MQTFHFLPKPHALIVVLSVITALLACSASDIIGQHQQSGPTATAPVFATATPGGRVSVYLATSSGATATLSGPTPTSFGQVVAPAATATAAYATMLAATATAGATLVGPVFQPTDCPVPGSPPPPAKPASFSQYPETIGRYLSAGGAATILESTLRGWGAVSDGAVVQTDTDLTGDGVNDILVTLYDPSQYHANQSSPGEMLIYGCAQKGYRLLYNTPYSPATIIPELKRVGDMNNDARAEVAYTQKTCVSDQCTQVMNILSWNGAIGAFVPLNNVPMNATNGKAAIADLDKDGVLEVSITFSPPGDAQSGPPRRSVDIWDWNGVNYLLALTQLEAPVYRIHALYDADAAFAQGDFKDAVKLYDRVRNDGSLQSWTVLDEQAILQANATYKKLLSLVSMKSTRTASDTLNNLQSENPAGSPGEGYAIMGQAFMDNYNRTRDRHKACADALTAAASRPEILGTLNSYGTNNRTYSLSDLCPFTEK